MGADAGSLGARLVDVRRRPGGRRGRCRRRRSRGAGRGRARSARRSRRPASTPIEEIQPSRHRVSLPLGPGADETAVFDAIAKSTRQRIRGAEKAGVVVVRHDARDRRPTGQGRASPPRPRPPTPLSTASTTCCSRRASGGTSRSVRAPGSSPGGGRRSTPATSSTSRRAPTPPPASRWRASSCIATADASRPSTRATMRPAGATTRARSTCCAGGRSSWRCGRTARRWTSEAWTWRARAVNRSTATRCTGSTSTRSRSAVAGSS